MEVKQSRTWEEVQQTIHEESERLRARLLVALENGDLPAFEVISSEAEELISRVALEGSFSSRHVKRLIMHGEKYQNGSLCLYDAIGGENEELVLRLIDFGAELPGVDSVEWHSMLNLVADFGMMKVADLLFVDATQVDSIF